MIRIRVAIALSLVLPASLGGQPRPQTYDQLLALFTEWRTFEDPPRLAGGVPDYTPATNANRLPPSGNARMWCWIVVSTTRLGSWR